LAICLAALSVPARASDNLSVTEFGEWGVKGSFIAEHKGDFQRHRSPRFLMPSRELPKSGSATYTGSTFGSATIGTTPYFVTGTETLNAQFGAQSTIFGNSNFGAISGSFNLNKTAVSNGATTPFASFSTGGPLVGTQFPILNAPGKAFFFNATETFGSVANSNTAVSGSATGTFFGPKGQTLNGSWNISSIGTIPPSGPITAQGAFTAHR
jgi:hypothetical protein